jgi:hypothetical protein
MAGTYIDGSTVYIGKGTSTTQCFVAPNMPARITTATGSAGAHMPCHDVVDKLTPFYLKDNPQLIWVKGDVKMTAYMYPVLVVSGLYQYNIGRVNLLNGTTTYQQIGKITLPYNGVWYSTLSTVDKNETNFDRLVCDGPPPPVTSGCSFTKDLFDSSGKYISSVCLSKVSNTSTQALDVCRALNMMLFTISSVEERDVLLAYSKVYWASSLGKGSSLWVSGVNESGWKDANNRTTALGSFAYPTKTNRGGSCLNVGSFDGVQAFELVTEDCNAVHAIYCEFLNSNPVA